MHHNLYQEIPIRIPGVLHNENEFLLDYNNNMFRFIYYNKEIKETFKKTNDFRDYQLYYGIYPPRYVELVKRNLVYSKEKREGKRILWFPTWRDYLGDNPQTEKLLMTMKEIISNKILADYLEKTSSIFTVCLHQFFDADKIAFLKKNITTGLQEGILSAKKQTGRSCGNLSNALC